MKQLCRATSASKVEYMPRDVLAGPHTWEFGGVTFTTVLVRSPDNKPRELSCIDVRSGYRLCCVPEVRAPKTKAHDALFRTSKALQELETRAGLSTMSGRIRDAAPIPEHIRLAALAGK